MNARVTRRLAIACCVFGIPGAAAGQDGPADGSGSVRVYADGRDVADGGPLAQARRLAPDIPAPAAWTAGIDATLKARWKALTGAVTLLDTQSQRERNRQRLVLDELALGGEYAGLHVSLGKKVVSWDVGQAFRPNDIVQQEARRVLVPTVLEGRPLGLVERFDAQSAWSLVLFHQVPRPEDQRPALPVENVLAARFYRRLEGGDVYAFGRWGSRSRGGVGSAISLLASDAVELHASYARTGRIRTPVLRSDAPVLADHNPFELRERAGAHQLLLGMTWTNASQLSLLVEGWYDGTAPSDAFWNAWGERTTAILGTTPAPGNSATWVGAASGNLGWQASQLRAGALRRSNLYVRASWTNGGWQPAIDLLTTPQDGGYVLTASLGWQGDRLRADAGIRAFGGPRDSLYAQTPWKSIAYLGLTLPF